MAGAPAVLSTLLGLALVGAALRDIFIALFHPEGACTVGPLVTRGLWRAFRSLAGRWPDGFALAGPVGLVVVISLWATLLISGWALVYWPQLPDGFDFTAGPTRDGLDDALNLSLVSLTTLGFSDVVPASGWLRIAAPLEALLGFGLLSASISWLLLIVPALSRRRSLAYEVTLLWEAERDSGTALEQLDFDTAERLLAELTSRLVAVERDLVSFPASYYFRERDQRFALAAAAAYLLDLAERGAEASRPAHARFRARLLSEAVADFAVTTARFHRASGTTRELLAAYADDHLRTTLGAGS